MIVNIWLGISDAAQDVVLEALRWDEESQGQYTGPLTRRQRRLFEYMQDETTRRRLFKKPTLAGTVYNLWSFDFDDEKDTLQLVKDELDGLIAQYPNQIAILGAWRMDGRQIGANYDQDGNRTSEAMYPIPNFLWRFMPDEVGATSNADLTDVNILYGQSPRDFS